MSAALWMAKSAAAFRSSRRSCPSGPSRRPPAGATTSRISPCGCSTRSPARCGSRSRRAGGVSLPVVPPHRTTPNLRDKSPTAGISRAAGTRSRSTTPAHPRRFSPARWKNSSPSTTGVIAASATAAPSSTRSSIRRGMSGRASIRSFDCEIAQLYTPRFADLLCQPPTSAFLADGSAVAVMKPTRI